jgi:peptide/nickel transport system substrate-binding protein
MFHLKNLIGILSLGLASAGLAPGERLVVGQTSIAGALDPTKGSYSWSLTSHGISEKLFTVDETGELVGQVGESVTKISGTVWEVEIKPNYKFSDGTPVDAKHVVDCLMLLNKENSSARSSLGSITASVVDDITVRIESEKTTHIMTSVLAEWVFVIFKKDSDGNFIFTGPYVPEHFAEDHIDLVPNEFYPQAEERTKIELKKFENGDALAAAVEKTEVDIGFHLPIDKLPALRDVEGIQIRSFEVGYHYMIFYNMDSVPDIAVRKAIDLAIDRTELSQELAGGHATRSLFPDNSPFYSDDSDQHGDLTAAKNLLNADGWVLNTDGKRTKNGEELTIRLVAYPHRPGLGIMQPLIAEAIEKLGIHVETILTGDNWDETQGIIDGRTFDMLMWAQHTLPAGDPYWFLSSFFHTDGGSNHANFSSDPVDFFLDNLSKAEGEVPRVEMTVAAQRAILDEVPVSNLVTPMWHVSLSDAVGEYKPYGADYYIIRADLRAIVDKNSNESGSSMTTSGAGAVLAVVGLFFVW